MIARMAPTITPRNSGRMASRMMVAVKAAPAGMFNSISPTAVIITPSNGAMTPSR